MGMENQHIKSRWGLRCDDTVVAHADRLGRFGLGQFALVHSNDSAIYCLLDIAPRTKVYTYQLCCLLMQYYCKLRHVEVRRKTKRRQERHKTA